MIRKCLVGIFLTLLSYNALSQSKINVHINNLQNNKGTCIVCLYNSAKEFSNKGKPVECKTVTVANKSAGTVFENVAPGTYAILVIHDANNNRKFDTNFMGMPKEGYGASQNKLPFAAAPKFDENSFTVTENSTTNSNIRLRYLL